MDRDRLITSIIKNEGFRVRPYLDSLGIETVGIGFNIKYLNFKRYGLNKDNLYVPYRKSLEILNDKIDDIVTTFFRLDWTEELPECIQEIFIEQIYQIGWLKFYKFRKMIKAAKMQRWDKVIMEMKDSVWYEKQTPKRIDRYIKRIKKELL